MPKKKTVVTPEKRKDDFKAATSKVVPHPTPERGKLDNLGLAAEKAKRPRRTKEEMDAERQSLIDDGFEIFANFMKTLSDNDARHYGFAKVPVEEFYPLSKQYAQVVNYFLPKTKPIYFICVSAGFSTYNMLRTRADMIAKVKPKETKSDVRKPGEPEGKPSDSGSGKTRVGQEFPSKITPERVE